MGRKYFEESDGFQIVIDSDDEFLCELKTPKGLSIEIEGQGEHGQPIVRGDELLTANRALGNNLWLALIAHAKAEALESQDPEGNKRQVKLLRKQSRTLSDRALKLATWYDAFVEEEVRKPNPITYSQGFCSSCLEETFHMKIDSAKFYLCGECGEATVKCSGGLCSHMARWNASNLEMLPLCAEHSHEISSFEHADLRITDLCDFEELREYRSSDVKKIGKTVAAVGTTVIGGGIGAFMLRGAIGGLIGTSLLGLKGAAATNAGLAWLGLGSLAAGGYGMAGGAVVISAAGGILGGKFGLRVVNAYLGEDSSFGIERISDGSGTPVLVAKGFLTKGKKDWERELKSIKRRYPESPVYAVHWGSGELEALGLLIGQSGIRHFGAGAAKGLVAKASKKLGNALGPIGGALNVANLADNPWHVAVNRADKTADVLAAIIQRSEVDRCILVGHSLGGRVMARLAALLAGVTDPQRQVGVEAVHLMGAAVARSDDWFAYDNRLIGTVHNYHSRKDQVLVGLFRAAMLRAAVGAIGFGGKYSSVVDHDVSGLVKNHGDYYAKVELA